MKLRFSPLLILALVGCAEKPAEKPGSAADSVSVVTKAPSSPGTTPVVTPAPVVQGIPFGIPGTEPAVIDTPTAGVRAYIYSNYLVIVRDDTVAGIGEQIQVTRRLDGESAADGVARALRRPDHTIPTDDASFFFGLGGNRVFVDQGTGPEPRGLMVFDPASGKTAYSGTYSVPIRLLDSNRIEFYKEIEKPATAVDCPEQAKWTAGGLGIAWERRVVVDLGSAAESPTDDVRCAPRQ